MADCKFPLVGLSFFLHCSRDKRVHNQPKTVLKEGHATSQTISIAFSWYKTTHTKKASE
jgi:hypothetical protein